MKYDVNRSIDDAIWLNEDGIIRLRRMPVGLLMLGGERSTKVEPDKEAVDF